MQWCSHIEGEGWLVEHPSSENYTAYIENYRSKVTFYISKPVTPLSEIHGSTTAPEEVSECICIKYILKQFVGSNDQKIDASIQEFSIAIVIKKY